MEADVGSRYEIPRTAEFLRARAYTRVALQVTKPNPFLADSVLSFLIHRELVRGRIWFVGSVSWRPSSPTRCSRTPRRCHGRCGGSSPPPAAVGSGCSWWPTRRTIPAASTRWARHTSTRSASFTTVTPAWARKQPRTPTCNSPIVFQNKTKIILFFNHRWTGLLCMVLGGVLV